MRLHRYRDKKILNCGKDSIPIISNVSKKLHVLKVQDFRQKHNIKTRARTKKKLIAIGKR